MKDNQVVTAIHPPLQEIRINTTKGDITASPFKKGREAESSTNTNLNLEDIKKLYHQNNFTNQIFHTISQHVEVLNTKVDSIPKPPMRFPNDISAPHFQP